MANAYPFPGYSTSLPTIGSDGGVWGYKLNNFLSSSHTSTGYLTAISVQNTNYSMQLYPGETVLASGNITITLPTAVNNSNIYTVKKTDGGSNVVTIATSPNTQKIDGGSTATLKVQYASITVVSDGSNWYVI